jgi:hypothetical protein
VPLHSVCILIPFEDSSCNKQCSSHKWSIDQSYTALVNLL